MRSIFVATIASALSLVLSGSTADAQVAPGVRISGHSFHMATCAGPAVAGTARCHAHIVTDRNGRAMAARPSVRLSATAATSAPYNPAALWSAYYGSTAMPTGSAVVAIVDAYGYASAATDLAVYRSTFGLPPLCSTTVTANCVKFTKLNQNGLASNYPSPNAGWAEESALDLDMVSAMCPKCSIVLVEANSASFNNLANAELAASKVQGVVAISNSYGGGESGTSPFAGYYSPVGSTVNGYAGKITDGVVITASSGDSAYAGGTQFPASAPFVIAVGGTSLTQSAGAWSQTAWADAGSGCSTVYALQSWQRVALPAVSGGCAKRMVADTSAVADPNTGVFVYYGGGWYEFGGTSVAAPLMAGIYGQAGVHIVSNTGYGQNLYANASSLYDVTSGNTGTCSVAYFCKAGAGYDGPTGLGTPAGATAPF